MTTLLATLGLLAGCTAPKYKAARKPIAPVLLNFPSTVPPVEAVLHTVIIFRGPGSWKQNAYWDEYVLTVANRGDALVTVDSASLTDFRGVASAAGNHPWRLEQLSHSNDLEFAKIVAIQIGGSAGATALGIGLGALVAGSGGGIAAGAGATLGGVILLPAFIGGTIYANVDNRKAIEREFAQRRLTLPVVMGPGQLVQGSLFFPISPGPQKLTLHCHVDDAPHDVVMDLFPISHFHLKVQPPVGGKSAK